MNHVPQSQTCLLIIVDARRTLGINDRGECEPQAADEQVRTGRANPVISRSDQLSNVRRQRTEGGSIECHDDELS
jgi:hypothetical protein